MPLFALVRRPSPRLAEGLVTHIDRSPVDAELALQQWNGYVAALQEHGWATTEVIPAPDCPDSAFVEDTMVVFRDVAVLARRGADERKPEVEAAAALEPAGATVVTVPLSKVLHLKSAITALPDGTIIGWPPAVDDVSMFPRFVAMPEESGAHVVLLDDRTLLLSDDCPQSAALLRDRGYEVVTVDIGEYIKLEGCVTCLSVRLREAPHAPSD